MFQHYFQPNYLFNPLIFEKLEARLQVFPWYNHDKAYYTEHYVHATCVSKYKIELRKKQLYLLDHTLEF